MSKHYQDALHYITKNLDWFEVAQEFAKKYPASFVRACQCQSWEKECRELMRGGAKIDAIKVCRQMTGWSLKEAKEAVERL